MQSNNLFISIVGAVIGLVLFSAFALPVITANMVNAGEEVTYNNVPDGYTYPYYDYYTEDTTIQITYPENVTSNGDLMMSVNGVSLTMPSSWTAFHAIMGENIALDIVRSTHPTTTGNAYYFSEGVFYETNLLIANWTITYDVSESLVTITDGINTYEITANNLVGVTTESKGFVAYQSGNYDDAYVTMAGIKNGTIGIYGYYAGNVTVGENNLNVFLITSKNGLYSEIIPVDNTNTLTYTATINVEGLTLVDGTTDIYTGGTPTFVITDSDGATASFTPIKSLVIDSVDGHATSGTLYEMVGLLPLLLAVALVLGVIGLAVRARLS